MEFQTKIIIKINLKKMKKKKSGEIITKNVLRPTPQRSVTGIDR